MCKWKHPKSRLPHAGKSSRHITLARCFYTHTHKHTHMCIYGHPLLASNECHPPRREHSTASEKRFNSEDEREQWEMYGAYESFDAASWIKQACWGHRQWLVSCASSKAQGKGPSAARKRLAYYILSSFKEWAHAHTPKKKKPHHTSQTK